ncbi:Cip1-interacting zinc finger protein [Dissostichus eleginoides]|uniref:Cip1-interacting zinc finger protein n=1 Tax=Dissostichus eleginoides TaxID=100907 RepID=A0AAD9BHU7_DISEL|nr:Cip1-interacting zinc finger protein [Dissostichus eleginoides]
MFNPHIHQQQQQQQQQQQFHQHLRQLQQLFQQQPPPPPPPQPPPRHHVAHHHHQAQRSLPGAQQSAPPPRMVNMCQGSMAPNPMLQGALLMQQMQGSMRGFGMAGQQFRQFFTAGSRNSLLGPVPMGMAMKSPMMGYPAARQYHQHDAAARQPDRKRDSEQMASGSTDDQPAASSTNEAGDKTETDGAVGGVDEPTQSSEEQLEEPVVKKQRTDGSENPKEHCGVETITIADTDGDLLFSETNSNTEDSQPGDCILMEEGGSPGGSDVVEALEESRATEEHSHLSATSPSGRLSEEDQQGDFLSEGKDASLASADNQEEEEGVADGTNKFYCYLCSITCHNQQNFKSHMNSVSHQQRMMEIQHMSNACLVTLMPRVHESLQEAIKDGEKKSDLKHWCATCHTHFTSSLTEHRRTEEHKLASRAVISSCTVCKKRFRTSQIFVEHLRSQDHRRKVEELQEQEGCEMNEQDDCSSKEVTLKDMASDEQYDADTVYGSSFFVPVAGFICRLCNKFYHFESSALHTHCKSMKHFEKLKRYRDLKSDAVESSRECLPAADSLRPPVTETPTDWKKKAKAKPKRKSGRATNRR